MPSPRLRAPVRQHVLIELVLDDNDTASVGYARAHRRRSRGLLAAAGLVERVDRELGHLDGIGRDNISHSHSSLSSIH